MKSLSSYFGGRASDRFPRRAVIISGWAIYAAVYLGFGLAHHAAEVWILFLVYGIYYGFTEPAEKAMIRDLAPAQLRGRAYGAYNFVIGISTIPASLLTGWLWQAYSPAAAMIAGAGIAAVAALFLARWAPKMA
jgi:MFS family permease